MSSKLEVAKRLKERQTLLTKNYNTYTFTTNTYQKYIKEMYCDRLDQKYLFDEVTKSKVYINQNLGYKSHEDAIRALVRAREDYVTQDQVLQRLSPVHGVDTSAELMKLMAPKGAPSGPSSIQVRDVMADANIPPAPPKLAIDPDLRERGIQLLRLALSKSDQTIVIARQVREILGMNFIGNLPWEVAPDWEACKALRDLGLLERKSNLIFKLAHGGNHAGDLKLSTQLDANGQTYTDVHFSITEAGRHLITALNEADPAYMVAANHTLVGEAGMRVLQIFYQHQGTMTIPLGLDFLNAESRLQKLINLEVLKLNAAEINIQDRQYQTSLTLTAKGAQMVKLALESGWSGWTLAPWETQREIKALKYVLEMLERLEDEVVDYQAQVVVMPQIASTRRGRGGFGMTARRYGGQVGEHTSFRWVGRKTTQSIELWQPEIHDAEFEEVRAVSQGNVAIGTTVTAHVYTTATAATTNGTVVVFPGRKAAE